MKKRLLWLLVLCPWAPLLSNIANAEDKALCDPWAAKIAAVQGKVEAKRTTDKEWHTATRNATYCPGDQIRVGKDGRASIVLINETLVRLDQYSVITLSQIEKEGLSLLELVKGIAYFISRVPRSLKVNTPFVNAAIEGTEFVVAINENGGKANTTVTVFEGTVLTDNDKGQVRLAQNESSITKQGQAPEKILLARPRDTVQWALYFPPIIKGDAKVSQLQQASSLLYLGRVKEASALLDQILTDNPRNGDAKALQAIIAIVNNDKESAFTLANDAVQLSPDSAAPHIAMSYAWQALLDLNKALASSEQAINKDPENAIAWARLAELQLSLGALKRALDSATKASELDSSIARTQTILGYAYLTQIKISEARATFNNAVELDQNDPLPHLGLGLAMIRKNELAEGRREIEIAASLDPNNAIIRSYLGKAYYEEKRGPLDAEQFAMAKELDPNDPTPYFYDAIRKQSENRPVEALQDLQESIELNDNRAVYRSSLLLDQDEAARSAGLARIYNDLGFDQLAQQEAFDSINDDFANHSAHRFLAESYANRPRHEIGRVSELLQSQLLAPLNINPVAPHLSESQLGIQPNAGPGGASFNEYDPLFARNQSRWQVSALYGNNDTAGDEVVYSQLYDNTSISVGQYYFETDGFRDNNDFQQDIVNFFIQTEITPQHSLQFELKASDKKNGDLRLRFDPDNFSQVRRETRDETTFRLGYHYKINPQSHLLGSFIYRDTQFTRDENVELSPFGPFGPVIGEDVRTEDSNARTAELQYIRKQDAYDLVIGAGDYRNARDDEQLLQLTSGGIVLAGGPADNKFDIEATNAYAYSQWRALNNITMTLGLSHDDLDDPDFGSQQTNPKFGLQWEVSPTTRLRAAGFRTLKRELIGNQTLEPTQVAGFNQFFDEPFATDAKNYGVALEHRFNKQLYSGLELTKRDLDVPITSGSSVRDEGQTEYAHRAYLYWTPHNTVSLAAEYRYEDFEREFSGVINLTEPRELTTHRLPLSVNLHYPNGWSGGLTATYYDQELIQPFSATASRRDEDDFWITDARLGYRLPKRQGLINLEIRNMFDEDFNYHDATFRTGLAQPPTIYHDRSIWLRMALTFD